MKKQLFLKLCLLLTFFAVKGAYAQLNPFTLTVTPTPQTCLGNGSLSFTVAGTTAGSTIGYEVYLLPNTTTPVATVTSTTVTSLAAGNYQVIATQSLGALSNTATATVTIANNIVPLAYTLVPQHVKCPFDGAITVNVTSGTAVSYEIFDGPVTRPVQTTNVFNNLPIGTYMVRVTNNCGNTVVVTVQLTQVSTSVIIDEPAFPAVELPTCNTIVTDHFFATVSGNQIFFPLSFEYTVFPPGGGTPTVITKTVATGNNIENHIYTEIPFYHNQQYQYNVKVTDACGNVFIRNNNTVNMKFDFEALPQNESCGNFFFKIKPTTFKSPYTITFVSAPAGFNPSAFNPAFPTHSGPETVYGSDSNPTPLGSYTIRITDACGHTEEHILELSDDANATASSSLDPQTCMGQISITVGSREVAQVTITQAPAAYTGPVPQDLSQYIIPGTGFLMGGLPLGQYTFTVVDECGDTYNVVHVITPSGDDLLLAEVQRAGCAEGEGSVKLSTDSNILVSVIITSAPAAYNQTLPHTVSFNIAADGNFYMNSLPAGVYVFETIDNCGTARNRTVTIQGYQVVVNDVDVIANCGSFNIDLHHTSNGNYVQSFWLQKWNEADGVWEHPGSGTDYPAGTLPNNGNSVFLTNNNLNINLAYTGKFRILKVFHVYNNGAASNFRCFDDVISTFTISGAPVINGAYSFPCSNNTSEVIIDATGVGNLTYQITTKNGNPFVVNNGQSNLFTGLEPATYNFRVTDACGNSLNIQLDINLLEPMEIDADGFCEGQDSTLSVQNFTFLTYEWYADNDPTNILSTTNVLDFPNFQAAEAGIYHVRISSPNPASCINQVLDFLIVPGVMPNAGSNNNTTLCNSGTTIDLASLLSTPHDADGIWADVDGTGALNGSVLNTTGIAGGNYQFTYTVTSACATDVATITVQLKDIPAAPVLATVAPACEGDNVQLSVTAVPGATYAWTGPNGFTSTSQNPLLSNATVGQSGNYSLIITVNGCSSPEATVAVSVGATPDAGADNNTSVCNDGQSIDLADYLSANADAGGVWTETSASGALTGSVFNAAGVAGGTYQFTYTASGCGPDDVAVITIELKDRPVAPVLAAVAPVCAGTDVQLSATAVAGAAYAWTGPNNYSSALQNPLLIATDAADAGVYSLTVTINGCTSPASTVTVVVNETPAFTLDGNATICPGQSTDIAIVPSNFNANEPGVSYVWYKDSNLLAGINSSAIEVSEAGVYEVEVTRNGCSDSAAFQVNLNNNAFAVELEAGCENYAYLITMTNVDEITNPSFSWTGPNNYSSSSEFADITELPAGEYFVTVTNEEGCSVSNSITVDNTRCFIPRGISPNDDEYNQNFDLSNLDLRNLMIFNRYGSKVYEKENYKDEWYGQSDQGELPTGTYFYVATLSQGKQVTGWVYLQREVN